jgi:hypothetical protein
VPGFHVPPLRGWIMCFFPADSGEFATPTRTPRPYERFPSLILIVEAVAQLDINLPWIVPVEAAEGHAIVEFHAAVGNVQRIQ